MDHFILNCVAAAIYICPDGGHNNTFVVLNLVSDTLRRQLKTRNVQM